jgi:glycosyltransferase involved in cell wall biosynthesis
MKKKIYFLLQIPPPIHGSSIVGKYIYDSNIINSSFCSKFLNLGLSRKLNEIGNNSLSKLFRYIALILKLNYNLIRFKPDLVYVAITVKGIGFLKDSLILLNLKFYNKRIIYHFHNKGIQNYQNIYVYNKLYNYFFSGSKVILTSNHLYDDVRKYFNHQNVFICHNGIKEIDQKKKKFTNSRITILFLSNLIKSKGIYNLIDSLEILSMQNLDFTCKIVGGVGDINLSGLLNLIKNKNLENNIFYLGSQTGITKNNLLNTADIFVHPTLEDCFPLVLLEAMQFGLPIISTKEGGIPDIVVNNFNGFLVDKNNHIQLANKIQELILNKNLRLKYGDNSKLIYKEKFTLEVFENNLCNILKNLNDNF